MNRQEIGEHLDRERQVGGSHYRNYAIQPIEYIVANDLSFLAGNVVKYVTRYKDKNGLEDINKAIHYLELIKEFEYPAKDGVSSNVEAVLKELDDGKANGQNTQCDPNEPVRWTGPELSYRGQEPCQERLGARQREAHSRQDPGSSASQVPRHR